MSTLLLQRAASLAVSLCLAGCTSTFATASPTARALPTDLQLGRLSERTAFEAGDQPDGGLHDGGSQDRSQDRSHDDGESSQAERDEQQRRRKGLFLGGVIASAVGGAGAIAFGAAGQITENQLDDAYSEGVTREDEMAFQDRGKTMNGIAIGGAAIAILGLGLTAVVLGIDYTHCGSLIKKRREACQQRAAQ